MKFQDLTAEEQKLLNTDLGEFDKVAAAEVALAQEMYATGFEKLAAETADYLDSMFEKVAAEDEKEDEKEDDKEDEETKKTAAELGAFIERGFFDGLRKLGAERHGDETIYLLPYLEEKVAAEGAKKAIAGLWGKLKGHAGAVGEKAREVGGKALEKGKEYAARAGKATSDYGKSIPEGFSKARQNVALGLKQPKGERGKFFAQAGKQVASSTAKAALPVAGVGGLGWGASKAFGKKKED